MKKAVNVAASLVLFVVAFLAVLGVGTQLAACAGERTALPAFRAYYDATATEYLGYVDADDTLSVEQKQRRHLSTESAGRFLDAAEGQDDKQAE